MYDCDAILKIFIEVVLNFKSNISLLLLKRINMEH